MTYLKQNEFFPIQSEDNNEQMYYFVPLSPVKSAVRCQCCEIGRRHT